jgi:hypothetical protein
MMTSNQYYGGLNKRFDTRFALLHKCGFRRHDEFPELLIRPNGTNPKSAHRITTDLVMNASNRVWIDHISLVLRRSR